MGNEALKDLQLCFITSAGCETAPGMLAVDCQGYCRAGMKNANGARTSQKVTVLTEIQRPMLCHLHWHHLAKALWWFSILGPIPINHLTAGNRWPFFSCSNTLTGTTMWRETKVFSRSPFSLNSLYSHSFRFWHFLTWMLEPQVTFLSCMLDPVIFVVDIRAQTRLHKKQNDKWKASINIKISFWLFLQCLRQYYSQYLLLFWVSEMNFPFWRVGQLLY